MRKRVFGRKLKRTTNQRKSLFKSLTQAVVIHGRIKTTEAKAKAVRPAIEKLITHAKKNDANTLQYLKKHVDIATAEQLVVIAPAFKDRNGGYTRIIKLGGRKKDNAPMVLLEFVEDIKTLQSDALKTKEKAQSVKKEAKAATPASKTASKVVKSKPVSKTVAKAKAK